RSYARNGSILDLQIHPGKITSLVSGSSLYRIAITINKLPPKTWKAICADCAAEVSTLLELLSGKLPDSVLKRLTDRRDGLFPQPREIKIQCSCPDGARMCKHAAATLYGVGHLLDTKPELFFMMRGVDQSELVSEGWQVGQVAERMGLNADANASLANADLGSIFGIELAGSSEPIATRITVDVQRNKPAKTPRVPAVLSAPNKTAKSKSATSQAVKSETAKSKAVKSRAVKG
ncbi:MAG: SWIM zinc finger family protein, partial [Pirellulaceae bacterium]|nr:SWIM zinc finger family protein [Pirellulaceae bacterium]